MQEEHNVAVDIGRHFLGSDLDGVPFAVWYVALGAGLLFTGIAHLRQRRFEREGDAAKARQLQMHVPWGLFICALIALRLILGA
jgi:hypothetical protein